MELKSSAITKQIISVHFSVINWNLQSKEIKDLPRVTNRYSIDYYA